MSKTKNSNLQRLELVLDHHGANPSHWSVEDRELLALVEDDAQAEQIFAKAEALDKLLDLSAVAQTPDSAMNTDLQDRIMVDFANVQGNSRNVVVPFTRRDSSDASRSVGHQHWVVPAALAACFALGIYLGGYGVGDWTLDPATSIANLSNSTSQLADITEIVMSSGLEEDLL